MLQEFEYKKAVTDLCYTRSYNINNLLYMCYVCKI